MADWEAIANALLDKPGTFLPWNYNDTATPQQQFRDADNPAVPTIGKLHNYQFQMEQNLNDPKKWWAVPDSSGAAGVFRTPFPGWGV